MITFQSTVAHGWESDSERAHEEHENLYPLASEKACLGAAILDNAYIRGPLSCLEVPHFGLSVHQKLFALMLESDEEGLPFDIITLAQSLHQRNRVQAIGDGAYISSLPDGVVTHEGLI